MRFLAYGGVELNASTGLVRLYPERRAVLLSSQQADVLAVLIDRAGKPCRRDEIAVAMSEGSRPPTMAQIGVIISNIRNKLGTHPRPRRCSGLRCSVQVEDRAGLELWDERDSDDL
ncbi:helix-turn-helix domain-containing protein, partial [Micromonospora sp. NPDC050200]|uniref:helix-turn-helix domain-containing protein n=1 Tax=Micromonospora sp. NPDC050200 TaxID=3155664 RepID=UPI003411A1BD